MKNVDREVKKKSSPNNLVDFLKRNGLPVLHTYHSCDSEYFIMESRHNSELAAIALNSSLPKVEAKACNFGNIGI